MDWLAEFAGDEQFTRLLCREDDAVDLTVLALEIARDCTPGLDFRPTLDWIAERGEELAPRLARAAGDRELLRELSQCLAVEQGITGSDEAFDSADGSCLNRVIENRRGIPLSLCLLYRAVAARQQIELQGVCAPGHFLLRYDTFSQPLFVDAFRAGNVLSLSEVSDRLRTEEGLGRSDIRQALEAGSTRAIALRILANLKVVTAQNEEWKRCARIQSRLLALQPAAYHERRDWGLIQLKAGRPGPALSMLEQCLKTCPEDQRPALLEHAALARRQMTTWN